MDMPEVITPAAKRTQLQQRIAQLEMELWNHYLAVKEFEPLVAALGDKTDAADALRLAKLGVESTTIRLEALREEFVARFPDSLAPAHSE